MSEFDTMGWLEELEFDRAIAARTFQGVTRRMNETQGSRDWTSESDVVDFLRLQADLLAIALSYASGTVTCMEMAMDRYEDEGGSLERLGLDLPRLRIEVTRVEGLARDAAEAIV